MKNQDTVNLGVIGLKKITYLALMGGVSAFSAISVHAQLVLQQAAAPQTTQTIQDQDPRESDRTGLREVMKSSQRAPQVVNTVQSQEFSALEDSTPVATAPAVSVIQTQIPATTYVGSNVQAQAPEIQNFSKSELMRRERVREEVKNEDILQERLESLRLRDEQARTDALLSGKVGAPQAQQATVETPVTVIAPQPMQSQIVGNVSTEHPLVQSSVPVVDQVVTTNAAATQTGNVAPAVQGQSIAVETPVENDSVRFQLRPKGGVSQMFGNSYYKVVGRYGVGLDAGVEVSDHFALDFGYSFSEFGVLVNNNVTNFSYNYGANLNRNAETYAFKQNLVDAGARVYLVGPKSRVRPFISGGGSYSKGFLNYDQRFLGWLYQNGYQNLAGDYELSQFMGAAGAGLDIRVTQSISIGAGFKYYKVLSSRESSAYTQPGYVTGPYGGNYSGVTPTYANSMYSPYSMYGANYIGGTNGYYADSEKQYIGGAIARSSFYSIMGNVTFSF